jgi:hypothetical protein
MQVDYDETSRMIEARARYFELNGFGHDGGYGDAWVNIKLGPVPVSFPNTKERVRAVRYHDLHHVLTGYATDNVGEFEISAWEIGAGCKDFWVAWFLNLGGSAAGLLRAPRRTFRAFVRGRNSRTLYGLPLDELMDERLGEVRQRMGLAEADGRRARPSDIALFACSVLAGLVAGSTLLVLGVVAAPFVLSALKIAKARSERAQSCSSKKSPASRAL